MEYKEFFKSVKGFLEQAEIHKRRGNNDFNPYLEMWSESNEVKLHSRLICGFLNPLGKHYQGDVFLETFLECVGLKAWFGNTSGARVYKEYKNIDMYITNGERHIIVENKIWAGDQDKQIERYIESIARGQGGGFDELDSSDDMESSQSEAQEQSVSYDNIAVLYLAPDERKPSKDSLGKWQIQGESLKYKQDKVKFKAITYREEILKWIEKSQAKVGCITNLNAALLFYKDVVQIITKTKENTMSIESFLTENDMEENMEVVFEILNKKEKIIESYHEKFVEKVVERHREQIESRGFEIIKLDKAKAVGEWKKNKLSYPLIIKPKDICDKHYYLAFCVEYYTQHKQYSYYGVRIFQQDSPINANVTMPSKIQDKGSWWLYDRDKKQRYAFDTLRAEFESSLLEFLDSSKIKAWNEKLKSYQA